MIETDKRWKELRRRIRGRTRIVAALLGHDGHSSARRLNALPPMTSHAPTPAGGDESSWGNPPLPGERPHEGEPAEPQGPPPRSETLEAELGALEATLPDESLDTKDAPDSR